MIRVKRAWTYGCPICGGKRHKRITTKIDRQRAKRAWRKDQAMGI